MCVCVCVLALFTSYASICVRVSVLTRECCVAQNVVVTVKEMLSRLFCAVLLVVFLLLLLHLLLLNMAVYLL